MMRKYERMQSNILITENKKDEKFLRKKTADFNFKKFTKKEVNALIARMKRIMKEANGVGLSANQVGLNFRMFVAEVPSGRQNQNKFYAVFNPKVEKFGAEKIILEEGCLSVPLSYGDVERAEKVALKGQDKNGKNIKIKAWGLLARVFQHEVDHLEGKLFIDKARNIHKAETSSNSR